MSRPARGLALLLATVLLLAPVVPFAAVGGAAAAPAGMSTIPDANVAADVPAGETIPLSASELEGGVMASQHADSLEVTLTTADHAASVMDADSAVVSGDGMALVLRDDQQSAGREVAIDAGRLQQALGYRPKAIYGTHEDGSEWTATAEYVDGYLVFDVPHFSSNTVTFSGEVSIDATGAPNGTQFEYEVANASSVANAELTLTGSDATQSEQRSYQRLKNGSTRSINIGGNTQAKANITITGVGSGAGSLKYQTSTVDEVKGVEKYGDKLYIASKNGVYSLKSSDGSQIWAKTSIDARSVAVDGSGLYIGKSDDVISKLNKNDGSVEWTSTELDSSSTPAIEHLEVDSADNRLYAAFGEGLGKVKTSDGTIVNKISTDVIYGMDYNPSNKEIYVGNYYDGVKAYDTDLSVKWSENTYTKAEHISYDEDSDAIYATTYNSDRVYRLNISNRSSSWSVNVGSGKTAIDSGNGRVLTGNSSGNIKILDNSDGSIIAENNDLGQSTQSIKIEKSAYVGGDGTSGLINIGLLEKTTDPKLDIGSDTVSSSGVLNNGQTITETVTLDTGSVSSQISTSEGVYNLSIEWNETTQTTNPSISITSDNGSQTVDYSGTLSDGSAADISNEINESRIGGSTTVTATVDDPASGPPAKVNLNYTHSAQDQISTSYQASTFEESYNISHTYADATENAQVTIPFASSRVVGVKNVEYRVDGGSWASVAPANYRLDGTTLDVYLDDATGGVEAGQTVDVRATGRKISVDNGKVTVTDPTAPGEELDTELRIDSRQSDFAVNVGPTDDGDRVHYAYSPYFPTEDYVVIQANGDQDLHLPNAVTGDRFRVRHLDTRVVAERGDVRIDVVKAGENPELDVSPGPGGDGDPVTVEYYNTETGVKYLLNSLTRSIVVDSDVAESPAIFEDDDSEDRWAILTDTGPSGTSSSSGAVGQFTERASGAVGSVSLPIDGSGLGQLALVGVLGLGGLLVLRRFNPFGGSSDSAAVTSSTSTGSASGSAVSRLTGLVSTAGAVGSRAAQTTGSGVLAALRRLLAYFGEVATLILGNRRASITAGVVAAIVAARVGLVSLPEGTGILIVVAGVPVATWLILRQNNAASTRVWLGSTIAAVILGLEFVAPGTVQTAIEQLTSETVAPLLILVAAGGLYLWYRARQSDRPQIIIGGDSE